MSGKNDHSVPLLWFVTGSQDLYGSEALLKVTQHATEVVNAINASRQLPVKIVIKSIVKSPEVARQLAQEANGDSNCVGLVLWMHTFSPAKMWIGGLKSLRKPLLHFHTQFNRDLP